MSHRRHPSQSTRPVLDLCQYCPERLGKRPEQDFDFHRLSDLGPKSKHQNQKPNNAQSALFKTKHLRKPSRSRSESIRAVRQPDCLLSRCARCGQRFGAIRSDPIPSEPSEPSKSRAPIPAESLPRRLPVLLRASPRHRLSPTEVSRATDFWSQSAVFFNRPSLSAHLRPSLTYSFDKTSE